MGLQSYQHYCKILHVHNLCRNICISLTIVSKTSSKFWFKFKLGFTPCKAEQPLERMELQEKEAQKDWSIQEISLERTYSEWVSVNSRLKAI